MTKPQRQEVQIWLGLLLLCIATYLIWPELDLWTAQLFYISDHGFIADHWPWIPTWHMAVPWIGRLMVVTGLVLLTIKPRWLTVSQRRSLAAFLVCMLLGLWLIMHEGFKDNWGRPRPNEITNFGFSQTYSSPLTPSNACATNCSFMSGHAGTGFALIALGALTTTRSRRRWLVIGWAAGLTLGLVRMGQGGHFLGDVVFGGLLLWACAWITRWAYVRWRALRVFPRQ